jgi:hypothetical protein
MKGRVGVYHRIDFDSGSSIDGPLIVQIGKRLRALETASASSGPLPYFSFDLSMIDDPTNIQNSLGNAALGVLVVDTNTSNIVINDTYDVFNTAANGTSFRFGNTGLNYLYVQKNGIALLTVTPNEFATLVKFNATWLRNSF